MKKKVLPVLIASAFIILLIAIMLTVKLVQKYTPSHTMADLDAYYELTNEDQVAVVLNRQVLETKGKYVDGAVYLDYETVHDELNQRFYWDSIENKLLYTTADDVIQTEAGSSDYYVSNKKKTTDYGVIAKIDGDQVYVNLEFVKAYTDLDTSFIEDPNRVVITSVFEETKQVTAGSDTEVRYRGGVKSDILEKIKKGTALTLLDEGDNWDQVMTEDGLIGYVRNKNVNDAKTIKPEERTFAEETFDHVFVDGTVNMAWHQVTSTSANSTLNSAISQTKGINVISPTWFYLNNDEGNIVNLASSSYVSECHSKGIAVWGLVSNLENKDVDSTQVLKATSSREKVINKLVAAAIEYNLDGLNVDFESLSIEVGDGYIQFIRELSLKCHNNGLVLSVDNYVPSEYTKFYNRSEQAVFADYIVIMAYDEHYAGSDAGSVSSIGYVKDAVTNTLEEVPANQIILGVPFYTRLWQEKPVTNDENEITDFETLSQAMGMDAAKNMADVNGAEPVWDEGTGQYYVEYENGGSTYKMWMEEATSIEKKLQVVKENNLAGASFWKLGFERASVWDTIIKYLPN